MAQVLPRLNRSHPSCSYRTVPSNGDKGFEQAPLSRPQRPASGIQNSHIPHCSRRHSSRYAASSWRLFRESNQRAIVALRCVSWCRAPAMGGVWLKLIPDSLPLRQPLLSALRSAHIARWYDTLVVSTQPGRESTQRRDAHGQCHRTASSGGPVRWSARPTSNSATIVSSRTIASTYVTTTSPAR